MDEYAYMDALIAACRERGYTDEQIEIMGIMSGCEEAEDAYGSTQKAFEAATAFVKQSSSVEEALGKLVEKMN